MVCPLVTQNGHWSRLDPDQCKSFYLGRNFIFIPLAADTARSQLDPVSRIFIGRNVMPIYISRGRFTSDAVKGMVGKPENRKEAVSKLFESVGGKLIGWYLTFGRHDWLVIGEFPDDKACASAVLAAAAGGSLSDIETTPAMTAKDAHATFVSAGKAAKTFRSAGRA
jgi:uncharacterized protein with GYD domain